MTLNPYNELPTWLDEGLAMYTEGLLEPVYAARLNRAIAKNSLISVRSLSSPFSAYTAESLLSYAQSYSLVEFLIDNYGQGRMLELLLTFKQGSGYDAALEKVYGFDMGGLDALWRDYVSGQHQSTEAAAAGMYQVLVRTLFALATGLPLASGLIVESWVWGQG